MAAGSISFPCLTACGKSVKKSVNVVQRLRMRQLRGHLRPTTHSYPVCRSLYGKVPGRLGIPLKQIVDANALHEEGHVFLGFFKDGQFVLSYTLNVFADDHTAYPNYVYKLYWWRFRDNQPMQKVSEVRLFGEEEDIQQDLYLAVSTWPTDGSKVMVYGCCTNSKSEQEDEKLLSYVTITGVPSNKPCPKCLLMKYTAGPTNNMGGGGDWTPPELMEELSITDPAPPNCLEHGFAVHTKYELAPPFPSFSPKHSLAKDGVAVLNTGDSIIALAVSVGETKAQCASLYSPMNSRSTGSLTQRLCDSMSQNLSQEERYKSTLTRTCATQTDMNVESERENPNNIGCQNSNSLKDLGPTDTEQTSSCDNNRTTPFSNPMQFSRQNENKSKISLDNARTHSNLNKTEDSKANVCRHPCNEEQPSTSSGSSGKDLLSLCDSPEFNSQDDDTISVPKQEWPFFQESQEDHNEIQNQEPGAIDQLAMMGCGKSFTTSVPEVRFNLYGSNKRTLLNSDGKRNEELQRQSICIVDAYDEMDSRPKQKRKCSGVPSEHDGRHEVLESQASTRSVGTSPVCYGKARHGLARGEEKTLDWSKVVDRPRSWFSDHEDSLIGSEIDDQCPYHHTTQDNTQDSAYTIQECTCNLQGFAYSVRRYVEKMPYFDLDQPIDIDIPDYDSMLPVVVCGTTQTHPMVLTNRNAAHEGPFIEMKQLSMDAEHYICDTIRNCAPWGRRYIAFTDYDMQILEVCPNSSCIVVMIMALIRAWPESSKSCNKDVFDFEDDTASSTPKIYQTGFKFMWNLKTGKQTTFAVEDLIEFDQSRLRKIWNPGKDICHDIQRKWSVPHSHARGVHVLTNEAVFRNKSLNRLLDSEHYVAIVLT